MTTREKFEELTEIRIFTAVFRPDKKRKIPVNVRLCTLDEFPTILRRIDADPCEELAGLFLDPNTGERVFEPCRLRHFPKLIVTKLAKLYIDVNTGRYNEEDEN